MHAHAPPSFLPPLDAPHEVKPHILMTLDHSAQYLIATDSRRMVSKITWCMMSSTSVCVSLIPTHLTLLSPPSSLPFPPSPLPFLSSPSSTLSLSPPPPSFFPLHTQVIYILQLFQEGSLGDSSVISVTECLLTQPILSLVFSGHTPFPLPNGESGDDGEVGEEVAVQRDFDGRRNIVLIKLHCIQSRSVSLSVHWLIVCPLVVCPSVHHLFSQEHIRTGG